MCFPRLFSSSSSSFSSSSSISSRIALLDGSTQTKKLLLLTTKLAIGARSLCPSAVLELSIVLGAPLDGSKTMTEQRHALRVKEEKREKAPTIQKSVLIAPRVITKEQINLPVATNAQVGITVDSTVLLNVLNVKVDSTTKALFRQ